MTPVTCTDIVGSMTSRCQPGRSTVIAVSGAAGSGKSTLGRTLATTLRAPLLDLDTLTNPLLDGLHGPVLTEHWLTGEHRSTIRDARYAALRATAAEVAGTAGTVVLVAPFTAELTGGPEWEALAAAVAPAELRMVHLRGDAELFARRRSARAEPRDAYRPADAAPTGTGPAPPAAPHLAVDAELSPAQQELRVLRALGMRTAVDPDAPVFTRTFDAVLSDLDGVLADSTASVVRSWDRFARELGAPPAAVHGNHGRPARMLVEALVDPDGVEEGLRRIEAIEVADATGVEPVPGARELMASLPGDRVAVVTSGTPAIAGARLHAAGIAPPAVLVTADDVRHGKPDPEPYLLAARRLGVDPARCLVLEDAPAGVAAARAAGCAVVGVLGTVGAGELAEADLVVDGLDRLRVSAGADGLSVTPA
ncbi:putative phosphatase YfbT [Pseudonocardia sp. Ae707_Ps1]|nr:putative phosphatase YfbT [Pseudonocardia sp. Ae707_Ps1]